jgi:hypothetical protein
LDWTQGDLHTDNFIAAVAEQVTSRLQARGVKIQGRTVYLRNALNKFTEMPFDVLPTTSINPDVELSREKHNYSRLFTGAFYDILVAIYERIRQVPSDRLAIHTSRDVVGNLLITAVELGPVCELTFADMAKAFISADNFLNAGEYTDILVPIFDSRKILSSDAAHEHIATFKALPDLKAPTSIDSSEAAFAYLLEQLIPNLNLPTNASFTPLAAYSNSSGYTYMTYASARRINLIGDQFLSYNGSHLDVFGGLTVAFDTSDRLCSVFYRPVNDEDIRQIKLLTADLIGNGQVVPFTPANLLSPAQEFLPAAFDVGESFNIDLLLKNPLLVDSLPAHVSDFLAYLKAWMERFVKG